MDIAKLRDEAKRALGRKEIECLIGYQAGSYGFRVSAAFITDKEDVDRLIFSPICAMSLVNYLTIEGKPPLVADEKKAKAGKIAVVVRGCDSRAINQLLAEGGLSRDRLYLIGVPCSGVIDLKKAEAYFPGTLDRVEISEENASGRVRLNGEPYSWEPEDMVSWPFESAGDRALADAERERSQFAIVRQGGGEVMGSAHIIAQVIKLDWGNALIVAAGARGPRCCGTRFFTAQAAPCFPTRRALP